MAEYDYDPAVLLAPTPSWVAVHQSTLAQIEIVLAMAGGAIPIVDDLLREIDQARADRDRAIGVDMDRPTDTEGQD